MIVTLLLSCFLCLCNFCEASNKDKRNPPPTQQCYSDACMKCHCYKSSNNDKKKRDWSCDNECGDTCDPVHYHSECSQWIHRVHAQWSSWGQWSSCSNTCGSGTQIRTRTCDNPPVTTRFDQTCVGDRLQSQTCITTCKVDGGWSEWKNVSSCSVTCGVGVYMRNRTCTNPPPQNGGLHCYGDESRLEKCSGSSSCVVDGGWSTWKVSSSCSKTCDQGILMEARTCNNPVPLNGGQECQGQHTRFTTCNISPCPLQPTTSTQQAVGLTGSATPVTTGSTGFPLSTTSSGVHSSTGNILHTFTFPPFPTKTVQSSGQMYSCNKYEVIHGLGINSYVVHTSANLCTPDAVVYKYCNVSHHTQWNKGQNINEACRKGISFNGYVAVSSFIGNQYNSSADLAGVFVGCTTKGFKIAAQKCGSRFEVLTINNLTSTRPLDNPDNYYVILA